MLFIFLLRGSRYFKSKNAQLAHLRLHLHLRTLQTNQNVIPFVWIINTFLFPILFDCMLLIFPCQFTTMLKVWLLTVHLLGDSKCHWCIYYLPKNSKCDCWQLTSLGTQSVTDASLLPKNSKCDCSQLASLGIQSVADALFPKNSKCNHCMEKIGMKPLNQGLCCFLFQSSQPKLSRGVSEGNKKKHKKDTCMREAKK